MIVGGGIAGIHAALTLGQCRQGGHSGRTATDNWRPHGHVRQDFSHARLRRLHPDPQDDGGQGSPQNQATHLFRSQNRCRGLGRQLQGHRSNALRGTSTRVPASAAWSASTPACFASPSSTTNLIWGWANANRSTCRFPQAVPPVPVVDETTCLMLKQGKCKQAVRRGVRRSSGH